MTRAEAEKLMREYAASKAEADQLRRENAQLHALVAKRTDQVAKLTDRVTELLAIAQRRGRKPSPEKPPEPRPELVGDAKRAFEDRPKPPERAARTKPEKKKAEPTGRKPLPQHLEAEEHRLRPVECERCGSAALDVAEGLRLWCTRLRARSASRAISGSSPPGFDTSMWSSKSDTAAKRSWLP